MKKRNTILIFALVVLAFLGLWYFISSGLLPISQTVRESSVMKSLLPAPTPTPTLAPTDDINQELNAADDVTSQTNPDEFSSDVFLNSNLGL